VPLFEDLLRRRRAKSGDRHPATFMAAFNLGANYRDAGRLQDAASLFDEWLPRAAAALKPGQPPLAHGRRSAAESYARAGQHDKAAALWAEDVAARRKQAKPDARQLAGALSSLGSALLKAGKPAEAEPALRECLAILRERQPEPWETFDTQSLLGGALSGQKKYTEAEPLLVRGYQGLKRSTMDAATPRHAPNIRERLSEALQRLVHLYDAWGKPGEAAKWRKELEAQGKALTRSNGL
jgi:non-specific serine/threonine protein kinase/serine/threonine-protein kinase